MDDDLVIDLDDETFEILKQLAEKAGMPVEDFAGELLNKHVKEQHERATPVPA